MSRKHVERALGRLEESVLGEARRASSGKAFTAVVPSRPARPGISPAFQGSKHSAVEGQNADMVYVEYFFQRLRMYLLGWYGWEKDMGARTAGQAAAKAAEPFRDPKLYVWKRNAFSFAPLYGYYDDLESFHVIPKNAAVARKLKALIQDPGKSL